MKHSRRFKKTCNPSRLSFQTYVDYCIVKRKPAITTTAYRLNLICLTDLNQYHKCQRMPGTRFIPLGPMSGKALLSSITKGSWPRSNRVGQRKEKTGHKRKDSKLSEHFSWDSATTRCWSRTRKNLRRWIVLATDSKSNNDAPETTLQVQGSRCALASARQNKRSWSWFKSHWWPINRQIR